MPSKDYKIALAPQGRVPKELYIVGDRVDQRMIN
jgi:hypothetical protein